MAIIKLCTSHLNHILTPMINSVRWLKPPSECRIAVAILGDST